jgi:general secretion pathway protein D
MKRPLFYLLAASLFFNLSCAKGQSSFDSWTEKYVNENTEGAPETADKENLSESEKKKKEEKTSPKKDKDNEPLLSLDKIPERPMIRSVKIKENDVPLFKGPGMQFEKTGVANKDEIFTLLRSIPGKEKEDIWYQIKNAKGEKFFVYNAFAGIVHLKERIRRSEKVTIEKIQTIFDPTPPLPKELIEAKVITLNFEQTDIYDVITTFCDLLKIDYLIEGGIQGKITLQTFNNIPVTDLYSVLEQILAINNITVVKSGNFYRFLPLKDAITKPLSIHYGDQSNVPANDRLIIQIIPLKHVPVDSMKKIISPLLTKNSAFLDVPETNNLMLVELASNVKRIIKVIQALDIDKLSQSDVQLFKVEQADANIVVRELSQIFTIMGYKETLGNSLTFLPIDRLNSILIVNSFPDLLPTIEFWIEKLDKPFSLAGGNISTFVYYVQNGEADRLAGLLNSIFAPKVKPVVPQKPGAPKAPGTPGGAPKAPGAGLPGVAGTTAAPSATGFGGVGTPGTNGMGLPGTTGAIPGQPVSPTGQPGGLSVTGGIGGIDGDFEGPLTIIPDKDTNSLIIRTSPRNYPLILEVLKKLDLVPQQVLIEVLILDLTLDDQTITGLEWALPNTGKINSNTGKTGLTSGASGLTSLLGTSATSLFGQGASFFVQDPGKFVGLIQAFARDSKANVLANPILVTSNNKPANIAITNEIPIVTTTQTPSTSGSQITQQVQFRSVGVKLNIDPKINKDRFVNLKISQEISSRGVDVKDQPSFNNRTVTSEVVLKDNQILVMGGLMQTSTTVSNSGIPFLKDIPYLGRLFGTNSTTLNKTELMLFITPHIISNKNEAENITSQFKSRLSDFTLLKDQITSLQTPVATIETKTEKTEEPDTTEKTTKIEKKIENIETTDSSKPEDKPVEPAKASEAPKPEDKAVEPAKASEAPKPEDKPVEPAKASEAPKPEDKPVEPAKASEAPKPADKPAEPVKASEAPKPADKLAEPAKASNAPKPAKNSKSTKTPPPAHASGVTTPPSGGKNGQAVSEVDRVSGSKSTPSKTPNPATAQASGATTPPAGKNGSSASDIDRVSGNKSPEKP